MTIKIYEHEAKAGLKDKILSNNVVAYCSDARPSNRECKELADKALAENKNQKDLFYLESILVSTGWNKNDDVFDPTQVWASRNTPEDKQFNLEHDEKKIIGHITGNTTVLFNGEEVSAEEMPEEFEILIKSVLYSRWEDQDYKKQIAKIIEEIHNNEWSVSMECLFSDFDYAVESDGKTQVIARDEESSFLTSHLRAYGGEGVFQGYKIGRLLKEITFSGVGLVKRPANERSVIKSGNFQTANINDIFKQEKKMSDEVKAELDSAKEALSKANEKLASKDVLIKELKEAAEAKDNEIKDLKEDLSEANEKIRNHEKEIALASRLSMLSKIGVDSEEAEKMVAKFEKVDDETFAEIVAIKGDSIKAEKMKDDKEDDKEDEDETEADIENAEAEESDNLGVSESDTDKEVVAKASEWFKKALNKLNEENK